MQQVASTGGRRCLATAPGRAGRRWRRAWTAAAAGAALAGAGLTAAPTASATGALTATSTTVTGPISATGSSIPLTGVSVGGAGGSDTVNVTISTTVGTLNLPTTTGLTVANAYSFTGPIISFTGLQTNIDSDLNSLTLTPTGATGGTSATISISAYVDQSGFIYSPSNQHFYEYVASSGISWGTAETQAATQTYTPAGLTPIQGYLASIPNDAVNNLIATHIPGASSFWIGAKAVDNAPSAGQRQWQWSDGPLHAAGGSGDVISNCATDAAGVTCSLDAGSGYSSWASGEPNNSGGTETNGVDNYNISTVPSNLGRWNDFTPSEPSTSGYLVEFGDQVTGSSGGTGVATASSSVPIYSAPTAPTAVTATSSGTSATVSWTASSSTGGYPITGSTVTAIPGGAFCTVTGTATSCTITGLTLGTSYTFIVTSANTYATSPASTASSSIPIFTAPAAPTAVTATSSGTSATVSWTASSSTGGYPITGSTVTATPGGATCSPSSPIATSCTISGLTLGTGYTFTVISSNGHAPSAASAASSSLPIFTAPSAPTAVTATTAGYASATVSWTASSATGGYPLTTTTATASPGGASCSPASPTDTTCTITGLNPGTSYTFTVASANTYATSAASVASSLLTLPVPVIPPVVPTPGPPVAPRAPTLVSASATKEGASVSWELPAANGGAAISGFTVVYRDLTEPAHTVTDHVRAGATSDTALLVPGDHYAVSVAAVNAVGPGVPSTAADVVPFTDPQAPTSVTATPGTGSASVHWAAPANTGYTAILGYRVVVTDQTTGATRLVTVGPVLAILVSGLTAGRSYSVAVSALNAAGDSPSSPAATVALLPPLAVPPAQRRHEVPVPAHPATVRGPVRFTAANGRSHNRTAAFAATALQSYQLQAHQAVDLSTAGLFGYNSVQLTAHGRAVLRALVVNLQHTRIITCEGYSDYAVAPADAHRVSTARAQMVCRTLRHDGARVRTLTVGYGGRDPAVVGGTIRQRGLNRRVVLYVDR